MADAAEEPPAAEEPADAEAAAEAAEEPMEAEAAAAALERQSSNVGERGAALNSTVQLNAEDGDVQDQLRQILIDNAVRVIDLFRDWDDDGNGRVDKKEFRKAMRALGLDVPRKDVDGLFDTFDPDGGGSIDYKELNKALKRKVALDPSMEAGAVPIELKAKNKSSKSLPGLSPRGGSRKGEVGAALNSAVQIDTESDVPIQEQLRDILIDNSVRVIDLFRDWDDDGDGKVSKKEFRKAMVALGLSVPRKEADGLFDTFDPDGGGSIDYKELQKALKRRVALDPSLQDGAVKIELSAKNKSSKDKVQTAGGKVVASNRIRGEKGAALSSNVQVDPESDVPIQEQLRQILIDNSVRVIDLFKDWDDDEDGRVCTTELRKPYPRPPLPPHPPTHPPTHEHGGLRKPTPQPKPAPNPHQVSKKEFRKAMKMLGCESPRVPKTDVNAVFDSFDPDGGEAPTLTHTHSHPTPNSSPHPGPDPTRRLHRLQGATEGAQAQGGARPLLGSRLCQDRALCQEQGDPRRGGAEPC